MVFEIISWYAAWCKNFPSFKFSYTFHYLLIQESFEQERLNRFVAQKLLGTFSNILNFICAS